MTRESEQETLKRKKSSSDFHEANAAAANVPTRARLERRLEERENELLY